MSAPNPRTVLGGLDPVQLFDLLENHYDDRGDEGPESSWYRRLSAHVFQAALEHQGAEAVHFADLLDAVDVAVGVETAMRHAGFVLGFECCRQLLLGELDLDALKRKEGEE